MGGFVVASIERSDDDADNRCIRRRAAPPR
jgi:hypothetical protein